METNSEGTGEGEKSNTNNGAMRYLSHIGMQRKLIVDSGELMSPLKEFKSRLYVFAFLCANESGKTRNNKTNFQQHSGQRMTSEAMQNSSNPVNRAQNRARFFGLDIPGFSPDSVLLIAE